MTPRERLRELYLARAFRFGEFKLASGKLSSYYINSKLVLFDSEAISLLGDLLLEATADLNIQGIGGLEIGAIPMAAAACVSYHRAGKHIEGFFVRKVAKEHGSQERIEGVLKEGDHVVMIDDVLTTGGSVVQAIEVVEAKGIIVDRVVCVVDRLQGAREALAKYDYRPIYTIEDFGIKPQ